MGRCVSGLCCWVVGGQGEIKSVMVVNRLTKFIHLGALTAKYTAATVADFFVTNVVRLHGTPRLIVSDRNRIFTGQF